MSRPPEERLQRLAWIGDAVLSLWARSWLLARDGRMDSGRFARLTSNRFLACFGNPTEVEARFGDIYGREGLEAAFAAIERELVPLFERQENNRAKHPPGKPGRGRARGR